MQRFHWLNAKDEILLFFFRAFQPIYKKPTNSMELHIIHWVSVGKSSALVFLHMLCNTSCLFCVCIVRLFCSAPVPCARIRSTDKWYKNESIVRIGVRANVWEWVGGWDGVRSNKNKTKKQKLSYAVAVSVFTLYFSLECECTFRWFNVILNGIMYVDGYKRSFPIERLVTVINSRVEVSVYNRLLSVSYTHRIIKILG